MSRPSSYWESSLRSSSWRTRNWPCGALQAVFPSGSGEVGVISQPSGIVDVDLLVGRAQDQFETLEAHRLRAAIDTFGADPTVG